MKPFRNPTILIVDDEPAMRRGLRRVLSPPYEVAEAATVSETLATLRIKTFDIALVDVRLPDGDGYQVLSHIKTQYPATDVILMTGSMSEPDEKLLRSLDGDAYYFFFKPIDRRVLQALIDRCLRLRKAQDENRLHLKRLSEDLEKARKFQRSLLPREPLQKYGWWVGGSLQSCEAIGGDAFAADVIAESIAFSLCDVAGHGVHAAMYIGMVTSVLRALRRSDPNPAQVITQLTANVDFLEPPHFATMIYGRLFRDGHLTYFNAGHPDLILLQGKTVKRLEATGPLVVNVDLGVPHQTAKLQLNPGDRLLMYTDGLLETRNSRDEELGLEAIVTMVQDTAEMPCSKALVSIFERLHEYRQDRPLEDDVTVVMIERCRE